MTGVYNPAKAAQATDMARPTSFSTIGWDSWIWRSAGLVWLDLKNNFQLHFRRRWHGDFELSMLSSIIHSVVWFWLAVVASCCDWDCL